jgi:hypothetical protein
MQNDWSEGYPFNGMGQLMLEQDMAREGKGGTWNRKVRRQEPWLNTTPMVMKKLVFISSETLLSFYPSLYSCRHWFILSICPEIPVCCFLWTFFLPMIKNYNKKCTLVMFTTNNVENKKRTHKIQHCHFYVLHSTGLTFGDKNLPSKKLQRSS